MEDGWTDEKIAALHQLLKLLADDARARAIRAIDVEAIAPKRYEFGSGRYQCVMFGGALDGVIWLRSDVPDSLYIPILSPVTTAWFQDEDALDATRLPMTKLRYRFGGWHATAPDTCRYVLEGVEQ